VREGILDLLRPQGLARITRQGSGSRGRRSAVGLGAYPPPTSSFTIKTGGMVMSKTNRTSLSFGSHELAASVPVIGHPDLQNARTKGGGMFMF
jgi:hypothetical protein